MSTRYVGDVLLADNVDLRPGTSFSWMAVRQQVGLRCVQEEKESGGTVYTTLSTRLGKHGNNP